MSVVIGRVIGPHGNFLFTKQYPMMMGCSRGFLRVSSSH